MVWSIVSDSCGDLRKKDFSNSFILFESVPMGIEVGDVLFQDDESLDMNAFRQTMGAQSRYTDTLPPTLEDYIEALSHADCTICLTMSSELSASYDVAVRACNKVLERWPDKKIAVIDTHSIGAGMARQILHCKSAIEANKYLGFDTVVKQVDDFVAQSDTIVALRRYDNLLRRGGLALFLGHLLKLFGVQMIGVGTAQGGIGIQYSAIGEEKVFDKIIKHMAESKNLKGQHLYIGHCHNKSGATRLRNRILEELTVEGVSVFSCHGVTTHYAMDKGLIIGF